MRYLQDFRNFYHRGNNMVRKLIIVNVGVFLLASLVSLALRLVYAGPEYKIALTYFSSLFSVSASPEILLTRPWTVLTHLFFHLDFFQLLTNMLVLYWLGDIFREYLGNAKTLSTYIWGGIFGAVLFVLCFNFIPALNEGGIYNEVLMGASGGVFALVIGAATLLPYYEVAIFRFFIQMRWLALIILFIDIISITNGNAGGHIAHMGGALFGFLYVRQLRKRTLFSDSIDSFSAFVGGMFKPKKKSPLKVVKKDPTIFTVGNAYPSDFDLDDEPSQEVIDAILDKINQSGYESLTRKERDLLFKASKQD